MIVVLLLLDPVGVAGGEEHHREKEEDGGHDDLTQPAAVTQCMNCPEMFGPPDICSWKNYNSFYLLGNMYSIAAFAYGLPP
jgi:hypothetical protein